MANLESDARGLIDSSDAGLRGTPVFRATRVPVRTLPDYLESGQKWTIAKNASGRPFKNRVTTLRKEISKVDSHNADLAFVDRGVFVRPTRCADMNVKAADLEQPGHLEGTVEVAKVVIAHDEVAVALIGEVEDSGNRRTVADPSDSLGMSIGRAHMSSSRCL